MKTERWKVGTRSWDGTEYWVVETEDGAVVCMEPTGFSAYESGAFITPQGSSENACKIASLPDLLAAVELMLANEEAGGDGWWDGWEALKKAHAKANEEIRP